MERRAHVQTDWDKVAYSTASSCKHLENVHDLRADQIAKLTSAHLQSAVSLFLLEKEQPLTLHDSDRTTLRRSKLRGRHEILMASESML